MGKYKGSSGRAMSMPAGITVGVGVSLAVMLAGAALLAWLISSERMDMNHVGYGTAVLHILASAVGSVVGWNAVKHRHLMVSGICCAGYYAALLLIALLFGGQFAGMGVTALTVLVGGGIPLIFGLMGNRGGVRKRKFNAYR